MKDSKKNKIYLGKKLEKLTMLSSKITHPLLRLQPLIAILEASLFK